MIMIGRSSGDTNWMKEGWNSLARYQQERKVQTALAKTGKRSSYYHQSDEATSLIAKHLLSSRHQKNCCNMSSCLLRCT